MTALIYLTGIAPRRSDRVGDADRELARGGRVPEMLQAFELGNDRLRTGEEELAERSELEPAPIRADERLVELAFQRTQSLADRRLSETELDRRFTDGAGLFEGEESFDSVQHSPNTTGFYSNYSIYY